MPIEDINQIDAIMSIAEFYVENRIDPNDLNHMDKLLARMREDDDFENKNRGSKRIRPSPPLDHAYPLNESDLDYMAETRGWTKLDTSASEAPMASYRRYNIRLKFLLSTGTVGAFLEHPHQGKTQLFCRDIDVSQASDIFNKPQQHTGKGYHMKRDQMPGHSSTASGPPPPCWYGTNCRNPNCRFDHFSPQSGHGGRYWFNHPDGR